MADILEKSAWSIAFRGVIALIFGLAALFVQGITLAMLTLLFGAFVIIYGLIWFAGTIGSRKDEKAWPGVVGGIFSVVLGLMIYFLPGITALVLLFLIAFWALFVGIVDIVLGFAIKKDVEKWSMVALEGFLTLIFGILVLAYPTASAVAIIWLLGIWAILAGILLLALGWATKK